MKRLEGKVVLITGSGRGFGRSMAYAYALEGADVVGVALEQEELEGLSRQIQGVGGKVLTIPCDLSQEMDIHRVGVEVMDTLGRIDAVVNNAAACPWLRFEETSSKNWDLIFAVNLRAPFLLAKEFAEQMRVQGGGSIISITSPSAERGFISETAFSPTKYGIEGLTQCLAMELQPWNIAVNTLNVAAPPGKRLKPTGMTLEEAESMPQDVRRMYAGEEEMAEAFGEAWTFLALLTAKSVTGQRFSTRELSEYLRSKGWDAAYEKYGRKLTKAVYVPYDFPKSTLYQTPKGGVEKLVFKW